MKGTVWIGIILIVLGGIMLVFKGITYVKDETVVDAGPIELEAEQRETIPFYPVLGVIALVSGAGFVIYGIRKQS
ncbi:hypothetical protein GQ464_001475 [Rhodocaloribacter litoris]|uniref:DUF3185 domain-containing protein n=1 Tax=Rhodocaloribacter litoris TaxID=2558931 RepID=UPI0014221179|nr:DUF3185 domain-containing protein [Rhodocaloribacter litoris]QXD15643.1 hypothetical protein GQ464_001475 [Rhodocaloribacter litoris]